MSHIVDIFTNATVPCPHANTSSRITIAVIGLSNNSMLHIVMTKYLVVSSSHGQAHHTSLHHGVRPHLG